MSGYGFFSNGQPRPQYNNAPLSYNAPVRSMSPPRYYDDRYDAPRGGYSDRGRDPFPPPLPPAPMYDDRQPPMYDDRQPPMYDRYETDRYGGQPQSRPYESMTSSYDQQSWRSEPAYLPPQRSVAPANDRQFFGDYVNTWRHGHVDNRDTRDKGNSNSSYDRARSPPRRGNDSKRWLDDRGSSRRDERDRRDRRVDDSRDSRRRDDDRDKRRDRSKDRKERSSDNDAHRDKRDDKQERKRSHESVPEDKKKVVEDEDKNNKKKDSKSPKPIDDNDENEQTTNKEGELSNGDDNAINNGTKIDPISDDVEIIEDEEVLGHEENVEPIGEIEKNGKQKKDIEKKTPDEDKAKNVKKEEHADTKDDHKEMSLKSPKKEVMTSHKHDEKGTKSRHDHDDKDKKSPRKDDDHRSKSRRDHEDKGDTHKKKVDEDDEMRSRRARDEDKEKRHIRSPSPDHHSKKPRFSRSKSREKECGEFKILKDATFEEVHRPGVPLYGRSVVRPSKAAVVENNEASWAEQYKAKVMMTKTAVHGPGGPTPVVAPRPPVAEYPRPPIPPRIAPPQPSRRHEPPPVHYRESSSYAPPPPSRYGGGPRTPPPYERDIYREPTRHESPIVRGDPYGEPRPVYDRHDRYLDSSYRDSPGGAYVDDVHHRPPLHREPYDPYEHRAPVPRRGPRTPPPLSRSPPPRRYEADHDRSGREVLRDPYYAPSRDYDDGRSAVRPSEYGRHRERTPPPVRAPEPPKRKEIDASLLIEPLESDDGSEWDDVAKMLGADRIVVEKKSKPPLIASAPAPVPSPVKVVPSNRPVLLSEPVHPKLEAPVVSRGTFFSDVQPLPSTKNKVAHPDSIPFYKQRMAAEMDPSESRRAPIDDGGYGRDDRYGSRPSNGLEFPPGYGRREAESEYGRPTYNYGSSRDVPRGGRESYDRLGYPPTGRAEEFDDPNMRRAVPYDQIASSMGAPSYRSGPAPGWDDSGRY